MNYDLSVVRQFLPKTIPALCAYRRELEALPKWPYVLEEIYKVDHLIWVLEDDPHHYE